MLTIIITGSALAENYDEIDLKLLIYETQQEFEEVEKEFESTRFSYGEKIKEYTKALLKAKNLPFDELFIYCYN